MSVLKHKISKMNRDPQKDRPYELDEHKEEQDQPKITELILTENPSSP